MPRIVKELQPQLTKEKSDAHAFPCIYDLLVHYGQTAPRRKAILAPGRAPIRYGALLAQVNEAVRELRRLGIGPRDRVAVVLPNGPDAAVLLIAVAVAAVCVPLNPATTAGELQRYLRYLGKPALLTTEKIGSAVQSAALALGMPILTWSPPPVGPASRLPICGLSAGRADDAFILLTSGATSRPKMVPLAHASVCLSAYNAGAALRLGRRDRLLNVLPLFHAHGLISGLLTAVAAGSSVVCTTGFDATAFFGWLKEFRPTWYTAVPTIHRALLSAGGCRKPVASTLRLVRSASSLYRPTFSVAWKPCSRFP